MYARVLAFSVSPFAIRGLVYKLAEWEILLLLLFFFFLFFFFFSYPLSRGRCIGSPVPVTLAYFPAVYPTAFKEKTLAVDRIELLIARRRREREEGNKERWILVCSSCRNKDARRF